MARQRSNFRRSGPRRQTEWLAKTFDVEATVLPSASKIIASSMDADELAKLPFTITRTIGSITVASDQTVALEDLNGALGATIVSERALTVGITALPDPVTEVAADFWFLYQDFSIIGAAENAISLNDRSYRFDSRAQRKVEEGEQIVFIMANASVPAGLKFLLNFRMLIKLH